MELPLATFMTGIMTVSHTSWIRMMMIPTSLVQEVVLQEQWQEILECMEVLEARESVSCFEINIVIQLQVPQNLMGMSGTTSHRQEA